MNKDLNDLYGFPIKLRNLEDLLKKTSNDEIIMKQNNLETNKKKLSWYFVQMQNNEEDNIVAKLVIKKHLLGLFYEVLLTKEKESWSKTNKDGTNEFFPSFSCSYIHIPFLDFSYIKSFSQSKYLNEYTNSKDLFSKEAIFN